jgi:hypothetical protein
VTLPTGPRTFCKSPTLTWTATTTANPPWADTTPPSLRLRGTTVQRPLRRRRIVVTVQCPREPCAARASTTVAGVRLKTATLVVRAGSVRALRLALSARARRAIAAALRAHPSIRTKVTVVAADATGNRATAHRTITLRR